MLPDTTAQRTSVVRAQFEPERLDNLLLRVFTAKPNKALYCSFRSVVMLREWKRSDQPHVHTRSTRQPLVRLRISIGERFTAAPSGARGLTIRQTGRWSFLASP